MPTSHSLGVAAQMWTDPRTSHIVMIPELAVVFAEKLDEYKEAIIWMSGAPAFSPEGEAGKAWQELRDRLLKFPDQAELMAEAQQ